MPQTSTYNSTENLWCRGAAEDEEGPPLVATLRWPRRGGGGVVGLECRPASGLGNPVAGASFQNPGVSALSAARHPLSDCPRVPQHRGRSGALTSVTEPRDGRSYCKAQATGFLSSNSCQGLQKLNMQAAGAGPQKGRG